MLRSFTYAALSLFISLSCFSQTSTNSNNNNQWLLFGVGIQAIEGQKLDFNSNPTNVLSFSNSLKRGYTNASICDSNGALIMATNGMYILNKNGSLMPHGDSLNFGSYYQYNNSINIGYGIMQGAIIVPLPNHEDESCLIIHEKVDENVWGYNDKLLFSIVSLTEDNGNGDVVLKNQVLIEDTLAGGISAVRHSNGKDWWIIVPAVNNNCFYRFLVDENGIHNNGMQCVGFIHPDVDFVGNFSPDGTKYALGTYIRPSGSATPPYSHPAGVFNFDRSTGLLSAYKDIQFTDSIQWIYGFVFSQNSRFLYEPRVTKLYQWDTDTTDVAASKMIVGVYDGFLWYDIVSTVFAGCQRGADGKIYIGSQGPFIHVIQAPDIKGLACNLTQRFITMPNQMGGSFPNLPEFCSETTTNVNSQFPQDDNSCLISPNPASCQVSFYFNCFQNETRLTLEIVNSLGVIVENSTLLQSDGIATLNVSHLVNGLYYVIVRDDSGLSLKSKFVVSH